MDDYDIYTPHPCDLKVMYHQRGVKGVSDVSENRPGSVLDEETAVIEAKRCLVNHFCGSCDLCRYFCPDLCITRDEESDHISIDYDYCKGCGICAFICPKGAITMVREE